MSDREIGVGIVGCGNISTSYLKRAPLFRGIRVVAVTDMDDRAARQRAEEYGVEALSIDDFFASEKIGIVVNLTNPSAHHGVSKRSLEAGKHVYSEKPFVLSVEEGRQLSKIARDAGLRLGSAPDTILGGSHQLARHLLDEGRIGRIGSGLCTVLSRGMESWHPNPDFFFQPGGGPVLDLGPYHISNMVQLIGAVERVSAVSRIPSTIRTIGAGARQGEEIRVTTPTTFHAVLEFAQGAVVTFISSWDSWNEAQPSMTLHGEKGRICVPDPNFFGGEVRISDGFDEAGLPEWDHPFSKNNRDVPWGEAADYRTAGLADMAVAIEEGRPHRCNDAFALHVVDVMTSILRSAEEGRPLSIETRCERPAPLGPKEAADLMLEEVAA